MHGRIEKDEPLRRGHARAEGFMIVQGPFDTVIVEDHEGIEGQRNAQYRGVGSELVVKRVGVSADLVGEDIHRECGQTRMWTGLEAYPTSSVNFLEAVGKR